MKGIWILAIVASFVAGSIATGAIVFADDDDDDDGNVLLQKLDEILAAIESGSSPETEPLSQLKILDFQTTINSDFDATSDKQFIVEACGFAQDPLASLTVFRDNTLIASIITFHNIGDNPLDGACTTVGGNPNDKIILRYEANLPGGGTIMGGTMMLRTTPSAVASITPSP